ncbi:MAG: glycerophosphodiester phosphodiesterase family protein [Campylobacterota bacterium]|nr:glycerophosphodiester phosphodiesterase family protein [Campylobacterota bacterium]
MNFIELFAKPSLIAAHRGDRSHQPENTLAALQSSVGKCDFIEIDVQLSRDGIAVIVHDETLERTSSVQKQFPNRKPWRVADFTLAELKTLDFGSWFNGDFEPILTLDSALAFAVQEREYLNVEIKDMSQLYNDEDTVQKIFDSIRKYHAESSVLLSSFHHHYLQLSKKIAPQIPTAALQETKREGLVDYLGLLNVDACHLDDAITERETVKRLRNAGFVVNVYTVNDPLRQKELFAWGVNGVFTDSI